MNKLYIGNLPYRLERQELEEFFAACGEISEIYLVKDRNKRRLKGFGFVTFVDEKAAKAALAMDGSDFQGRTLKVSLAKDQADRDADVMDDDDLSLAPCGGVKRCVTAILLSVVVSAVTSYFVCTHLLQQQRFSHDQAMTQLRAQQGTATSMAEQKVTRFETAQDDS